jgi:hypothetical protein
MNESRLWKTLRDGMQGRWYATRIESSAGNGVPDVTFGMKGLLGGGFVELKSIALWPKRPETRVKLPLRNEQKIWIEQRGKISGNVWVLVLIANDLFLLDYNQAILACEGWTKRQWFSFVEDRYVKGHVSFDELCAVLKRGN